jgi:hypothetical protein
MVRPPPIISLPQKDALDGISGADGNAGLLGSADFSLDHMQLASTTHPTPPGLDVAAEIQGGVAKEMVNLSDLSEDYIRMAGEMANYISWDMSEPQPWLDFDMSSNNI